MYSTKSYVFSQFVRPGFGGGIMGGREPVTLELARGLASMTSEF